MIPQILRLLNRPAHLCKWLVRRVLHRCLPGIVGCIGRPTRDTAKPVLPALLAAFLIACNVAEAPIDSPVDSPVNSPEPGGRPAPTFPVTDVPGSCGTFLCCSICQLVPVDRVIDGDTFISGDGERIRLYGIDSAEQDQQCYDAAKERFRELSGDWVRVQYGPRQTDSHNRLLYYVYTDDGRSVDELMIREGLAYSWKEDGQNADFLTGLEEEARRNRIGCLW